jgi:hypothetical protein
MELIVRITPDGVKEARDAERMVIDALKESERYDIKAGRLPWEWEFIDDAEQAKKVGVSQDHTILFIYTV